MFGTLSLFIFSGNHPCKYHLESRIYIVYFPDLGNHDMFQNSDFKLNSEICHAQQQPTSPVCHAAELVLQMAKPIIFEKMSSNISKILSILFEALS